MATTRLPDVFEPRAFTAAVLNKSLEKSALIASTAFSTAPLYTSLAGAAGSTGDVPFLNDLSGNSGEASDDVTVKGTPDKATMGYQSFQKDYRTKSFSVADLASRVAGVDIADEVAGLIADYRVRENQKIAVAKMAGMIADNIANDGSDMVVKIGTDATGAPSASEVASFSSIVDAVFTMGDGFEDLVAIVMHSVVFANLIKLDGANVILKSAVQPFNTYFNKQVIIDDSIGFVQGTNRKLYTSYFIGVGAFGFGIANDRNVIVRDEHAGNDYGSTDLITSWDMLMHPLGYKSIGALVTNSKSPTLATYKLAASWDRVLPRKAVKIAALQSNG